MAHEDDIEPEFLARLVRRDEQAFNTLVVRYQRRIYALLLRMIGNPTEAEELAHEVFIQVFKSIDSFRGESKLSTWMYRIAVNLCKNRVKYLKVRHTDDQVELEDVAERVSMSHAQRQTTATIPRPDEQALANEMERIVREAILEVEESFRECLILRDVEDLSYEEIGQITGLNEGTVKSRIFRARALLRTLVEKKMGEKR